MLEDSLHTYPATLRNMSNEHWRGRVTRVFVTFEWQSAQRECLQTLAAGGKLASNFGVGVKLDEKHKFRGKVLDARHALAPSHTHTHYTRAHTHKAHS